MGVISFIGACLGAIAISWLVTPLVMSFAERVGAIDQPNERKVHIRPIPRLGGVAVFLAFSLTLFVMSMVHWNMLTSWVTEREGVVFFISLLVMFVLGIWDDIRTLKPLEKFLIQIALASLVYLAGCKFSFGPETFGSWLFQTGVTDYLVTVLWIVGVTNAVNLIDGLDGLAAGVATIAAMSICAISLINQDPATAAIALILAGSLVGFLRYNFNPAKVFLGDSGSLFTGFALAVLSLRISRTSTSPFGFAIPLLVLGLPIMDTLLAMVRRFLRSFLPKQQGTDSLTGVVRSIFSPDRSHIHHRLIARGFSHMRSVLLLYFVSFVLGVSAIAIRVENSHDSSLILLVVGIALVAGIRQLRYREMAILRNGILLRLYLHLYNLRLLRGSVFQGLVDVVFVSTAYSAAFLLVNNADVPTSSYYLFSLLIVATVQIAAFWLSGLYKGTINQAGVGDALRTTKSVVVAVLLSGMMLAIVGGRDFPSLGTLVVLDFFLVLTLIVCSRFSFAALKYLFEKEHAGEKRVLIYGADPHGVLILQNILGFDSQNLAPVGFLDDDPQLEGKYLNGYPILGGHWKLHRLLEKVSVNEILLSSEHIKPETLRRLKLIARSHDVVIRRFQIRLEDVSRDIIRLSKDKEPLASGGGEVETRL